MSHLNTFSDLSLTTYKLVFGIFTVYRGLPLSKFATVIIGAIYHVAENFQFKKFKGCFNIGPFFL
jgi:hypothetical protein